MVTLEIGDCWTCATCGFRVLEDGRGFIYSDGRVQTCHPPDSEVMCNEKAAQPTQLTPADPLLNECEREKELNNAEV